MVKLPGRHAGLKRSFVEQERPLCHSLYPDQYQTGVCDALEAVKSDTELDLFESVENKLFKLFIIIYINSNLWVSG